MIVKKSSESGPTEPDNTEALRTEHARGQELMGHATIEMTMRYSHLSPDASRDAVKLLDWRELGAHWVRMDRKEGVGTLQTPAN